MRQKRVVETPKLTLRYSCRQCEHAGTVEIPAHWNIDQRQIAAGTDHDRHSPGCSWSPLWGEIKIAGKLA